MEGEEFLASAHRRMVAEFIEAVLGEWACDMGDVERNVLGVAFRSHVETELAPELLALHALLLGAEAEMLGWLPEWLDRVQTPLPGSRDFFEEMGRLLDPTGTRFGGELGAAARGVGGGPGLHGLPVGDGVFGLVQVLSVTKKKPGSGRAWWLLLYSSDSMVLGSTGHSCGQRVLTGE